MSEKQTPATPRPVDDEAVGYRKPPKAHRFKPGQSGNPTGRRKGTRNLATDVDEELAERMGLTENGQPRRVSKQRALVKSLTAKAIGGNISAAKVVLEHKGRSDLARTAVAMPAVLTPEDEAILADYLARHTAPTTEPAS